MYRAEMSEQNSPADENKQYSIETIPLTTVGTSQLCTPTNCCVLNPTRHEPAPLPTGDQVRQLKAQDAMDMEVAIASEHISRMESVRGVLGVLAVASALAEQTPLGSSGAVDQEGRTRDARLQRDIQTLAKMITDAKWTANDSGKELNERRHDIEKASDDRKANIAETALISAGTKIKALYDQLARLGGTFHTAFGVDGQQQEDGSIVAKELEAGY